MTNIFRILSPAALLIAAAVNAPLMAQSLNFKAPTPLLPGENHGTIDNMVGSHYWSFRYVKGSANIAVSFTSMGLFGNPSSATIEVVLHSPDGKVFGNFRGAGNRNHRVAHGRHGIGAQRRRLQPYCLG
jgi:hypothetical protein